MITNHTQLLNALIKKYNLKSYLEIGVQNPANNFDLIRCSIKTGVDPEFMPPMVRDGESEPRIYKGTSDEFFIENKIYRGTELFDLIFIDGLHHADQVKRDFENSLRCLSDNGFIVWHDTLPENEEGTLIPRSTKRWWGNVYVEAMKLSEYDGIDFATLNIDEGCTIVWRDCSKKGAEIKDKIDWNFYCKNKEKYLRFITNIDYI